MAPLLPILLLLLTACISCGTLGQWAVPLADAHPELRPGPSADVVIDVRDPASGVMTIEMAIAGLRAQNFIWHGSPKEVRMSMPTFWDSDGRRVSYQRNREGFRLDRPPGPTVRVRYRVQPGGMGRHGHQGIVTTEFASFDGRVFLLPRDAARLQDVRLRVRAPTGWRVASPFLEKGVSDLERTIPGPEFVADTLAGSCLALGPFEGSARRIGGTEFRVFTHALWSEAYRERLTEKTFAIFEWFHRELDFDPGAPFAAVWTPNADGERVFGGSYSNGTCMEHPSERLRNFELLAHRLGHAMNGYPPTGMQLQDPADDWFREGWASYVELASTVESGEASIASRWDALHARYLRTRAAHPGYDLPLANESAARGSAAEFMHYVKGPLVVAMLADWIQARAGVSLEDFMAKMWTGHGRYQRPLSLRAELASFSGLDLEPFWLRMVDQPGRVIPVWQESRPDDAAQPVATVAGQPVAADYLLFLAGSGDFRRYADIVTFLEEEAQARAVLARTDSSSEYPDIQVHGDTLPSARRYAVALHLAQRAPAIAPATEARHRLSFDLEHPMAQIFSTLLTREADYERTLGREGVGMLQLRGIDGPPTLVVPPDKPVLLEAHWLWSPAEPLAVALEDGTAQAELRVRGARPKGRSRSFFPAKARGRGEIVAFELRDGEQSLSSRSFWQRAVANEAPTPTEEPEAH